MTPLHQSSGILSDSQILINSLVSCSVVVSISALSISACMRSIPGALFGLSDSKAFLISFSFGEKSIQMAQNG